jgi:hypothetical protein
MHPGARMRDVLLGEQRVQDHERIEIELLQIRPPSPCVP